MLIALGFYADLGGKVAILLTMLRSRLGAHASCVPRVPPGTRKTLRHTPGERAAGPGLVARQGLAAGTRALPGLMHNMIYLNNVSSM